MCADGFARDISLVYVLSVSLSQGAVYSLHVCADGFASGSKDGSVGLWDKDFKPITRLSLTTPPAGYLGMM